MWPQKGSIARWLSAAAAGTVEEVSFPPVTVTQPLPTRFHILVAAVLALVSACSSAAEPAEEELPEKLVIGGDAAYAPFEWEQNGVATGFNVDLARAISDIGNIPVEHRLGDWPDMVRALETGQVDVLPMFVSPEREARFRFTPAFYYVNHRIYTHDDKRRIASLSDLADRRVAVEESSFAHRELAESGLPVDLVLMDNTLAAVQALVEGAAEYAILAAPVADHHIRQRHLHVQQTGPPLWPRPYAFAVRRDRPALAEWLSQALNLTIATGRYEEIFGQWRDRFEPDPDYVHPVIWLVGTLALVALLLAALAGGWSWSLRRVVATRTRQLRDELGLREQAQAQLEYRADHDLYTDLPAPHHFIAMVDDLLASTSREPEAASRQIVAVKLAQVERLVSTFGYATATEYVRGFADRLREMRFGVCGYLGRGVFAALAEDGEAQDLLQAMLPPVRSGDLWLHPQVVVGTALWPRDGGNAETLLRRAETALAIAIERGQSCFAYQPSMEPDEGDLELVNEFRTSGSKGLFAVYQPQLELASDRVLSAEALIRWDHPERGLIPPDRFLPLLENAGLIQHVTEFIVDQAVRMAALLRRRGRPCRINVNVTAHDLLNPGLPNLILNALERHNGLAEDFALELTETSIATDPAGMHQSLTRLHALGIDVALDDLGTGYSSLSHLSMLPIKEVKIDRYFVTDMLINPRHQAIVRSIIWMAHALGLTVVAEGPETGDTLQKLAHLGCDRAQGYGFSKPLGEDAFVAFLSDR